MSEVQREVCRSKKHPYGFEYYRTAAGCPWCDFKSDSKFDPFYRRDKWLAEKANRPPEAKP